MGRMNDAEPAPTVAAPPPGLWARGSFGDTAALAQLIGRFWYPAYAWLRASGSGPEEAARESRDFFTHLIALPHPPRDEPTAARAREYFLSQLRFFHTEGCPLAGEATVLAVDPAYAEARFLQEPSRSPADLYLRAWALRVLELSLEKLRDEYLNTEKHPPFAVMKPFLGFHAQDKGYGDAAKAAGMSASAFHLQVFSFRKRYRAILRSQIADTVRHADDADSELTALLVGAS
jgi:hypothetical protein